MAFPPLQTVARRLFSGIEAWLDAERDQLALWLPVALGTGITIWFVAATPATWLGWMMVCAAAACGMMAMPTGSRMRRAVLVAALLAAGGCALIWIRAQWVAAPVLDRPAAVAIEGRVETVEPLAARDAVRIRIAVATPGLPHRVRVNIASDAVPQGLNPGSRVRLRARLMPPPPPAVPGAYDFARVAWFQGIGATGRAIGTVLVIDRGEDRGFRARLAATRSTLSAHIRGSLPVGEGAIAAALATGDQGAIPKEDAEAMRRSGLAHLLSVSGLHVTAVVAATMFLALRLLALSPALALRTPLPVIAAGFAALAAFAYTLLAGAEIPTIRAFIAAVLVLFGMALGREAITLRLVATGALVVLLLWPEALASASFQLSFAAVTAIVALHEFPAIKAFLARRDEGLSARLGRALIGLLLTGLAVEIALAPIALFHFHRSGLYGAMANIVAIPLTTFVIMPLEALALLLDLAGIGAPAWWLTGKALALLLGMAHAVADAPGAIAMLPAMPRGAFALMIGGGLWFALWRTCARWIGLVPFVIGATWALIVPAPDLLVTGDGRHMAVRGMDGTLALLRPRAGDYVRGVLGENAGVDGEAHAIEALPSARCGADLCAVDIRRGARRWRLLATRSSYLVDIGEMNRACGDADIVISERRLPRTCAPRSLKIDRTLLTRTGGLAVHLSSGQVVTVEEARRGKPWAVAGAR